MLQDLGWEVMQMQNPSSHRASPHKKLKCLFIKLWLKGFRRKADLRPVWQKTCYFASWHKHNILWFINLGLYPSKRAEIKPVVILHLRLENYINFAFPLLNGNWSPAFAIFCLGDTCFVWIKCREFNKRQLKDIPVMFQTFFRLQFKLSLHRVGSDRL